MQEEESLGFGDGNNDLEMVGLSTDSYGMGNWSDELGGIGKDGGGCKDE
ncbi:HAD hydrolase family protein [Staphylococcus saprophyticus]